MHTRAYMYRNCWAKIFWRKLYRSILYLQQNYNIRTSTFEFCSKALPDARLEKQQNLTLLCKRAHIAAQRKLSTSKSLDFRILWTNTALKRRDKSIAPKSREVSFVINLNFDWALFVKKFFFSKPFSCLRARRLQT